MLVELPAGARADIVTEPSDIAAAVSRGHAGRGHPVTPTVAERSDRHSRVRGGGARAVESSRRSEYRPSTAHRVTARPMGRTIVESSPRFTTQPLESDLIRLAASHAETAATWSILRRGRLAAPWGRIGRWDRGERCNERRVGGRHRRSCSRAAPRRRDDAGRARGRAVHEAVREPDRARRGRALGRAPRLARGAARGRADAHRDRPQRGRSRAGRATTSRPGRRSSTSTATSTRSRSSGRCGSRSVPRRRAGPTAGRCAARPGP